MIWAYNYLTMKISIAQLNPIIGDLAGNATQILNAAQQCAGVSLLITSELSLCGYPPRDLLIHDGFIQEIIKCDRLLVIFLSMLENWRSLIVNLIRSHSLVYRLEIAMFRYL